jgi:tetratricopeptide (TPR) repeat protein
MKIRKEIALGIFVLIILASGAAALVGHLRSKDRSVLAGRIAALNPSNGPPETIAGLRTALKAYETRIEQHVKDAAQAGIYWKILAYRLQDKGLHNEALDALERAVYYNPADPALHYMVGISAGVVAKTFLNFSNTSGNSERDRYYTLAETGYLRAITLDDRYGRPRYGLGVLYVFELGRPREAIPHLIRYLEMDRGDVDAMFILARAYYMIEAYRDAVGVYDAIIALTKDGEKRLEAQNNRQLVMDRIYG